MTRVISTAGAIILGAFVAVCVLVAAYAWCWIAQEAMTMMRWVG